MNERISDGVVTRRSDKEDQSGRNKGNLPVREKNVIELP